MKKVIEKIREIKALGEKGMMSLGDQGSVEQLISLSKKYSHIVEDPQNKKALENWIKKIEKMWNGGFSRSQQKDSKYIHTLFKLVESIPDFMTDHEF